MTVPVCTSVAVPLECRCVSVLPSGTMSVGVWAKPTPAYNVCKSMRWATPAAVSRYKRFMKPFRVRFFAHILGHPPTRYFATTSDRHDDQRRHNSRDHGTVGYQRRQYAPLAP